jgi:hypothetical protein
MPEGTRVHRCVDKVKRKGGGNAYAICQASTHQSFATGKSQTKEGKPVGEYIMKPSLSVMNIAASGDPALFEHLMGRLGLRLVRRNDDPLQTQVQEEAVQAIASVISEGIHERVKLDRYRRHLKEIAEKTGYIVVIENFGDEMGGDEVDYNFAGEDVGEDPAGGVGDESAGGDPDVNAIAQIPLGHELSQEIVAVLKGEGDAGLHDDDMMPMDDSEDEFTGDMGTDEFPPPV